MNISCSRSPTSTRHRETSRTIRAVVVRDITSYPCNTPDGFTEDEARQATANAIRFWLSENGEPGSYSFTNRRAHPNQIRAKLGYEHVLEWADELLQMARDKKALSHAIEFTPSALTLDRSGTGYSGTTTVNLTNINSGYTLDTSGLPSGVTLTGFTGRQSETLTITAPLTAAGQTFSITATGRDTRALENMTAYIPANDSLQKIFLCANTAQVVATASFGVNTPAAGKLQIKKYGDNNAPLAGVKFGVYSDAACTAKITEVTTGTDGTVLLDNMNGGTYYVKELNTVRPYVIDGMVNTVIVKASETTTLEVQNETAKGVIRVKKTGEALVGTTVTSTEYGQLHTPKYQNGGLAGCEFTVKNESGTVVATLTTDADGVAETGLLPFGTYTVQETKAPAGYELDPSVQTVTLAYKDQNTPIVYGEVTAINNRIPTSVKIVKRTDHFNKSKAGIRDVPIPNILLMALIKCRKQRGFVCTNAGGTMLTDSSFMRSWEAFCNYLNVCAGGRNGAGPYLPHIQVLDRITAHMLRHTYATMLFDADVDVKSAQKFLGHADIEVTLKIYTHLTKFKEEKAIAALNAHLDSMTGNVSEKSGAS